MKKIALAKIRTLDFGITSTRPRLLGQRQLHTVPFMKKFRTVGLVLLKEIKNRLQKISDFTFSYGY